MDLRLERILPDPNLVSIIQVLDRRRSIVFNYKLLLLALPLRILIFLRNMLLAIIKAFSRSLRCFLSLHLFQHFLSLKVFLDHRRLIIRPPIRSLSPSIDHLNFLKLSEFHSLVKRIGVVEYSFNLGGIRRGVSFLHHLRVFSG